MFHPDPVVNACFAIMILYAFLRITHGFLQDCSQLYLIITGCVRPEIRERRM